MRELTPWRSAGLPSQGNDMFGGFRFLQREMDRLFDDVFRGFEAPAGGRTLGPAFESGAMAPRLDVATSPKAYEISVELPGVEQKDIDVSVADGVLTVKGEKKAESEEKDKQYHRVERSYGSFQRRLSLPDDTDAEKVEAAFKNGVLTITVPRVQQVEPPVKKIAIKAK
jgi:HSP20 family protein